MQTADSLTEETCSRCASPAPHLHPAIQCGGEVSPCRDSFHEQVTPENTERKIADGFADSGALLVPRPDRTIYRIAKDGRHYSVSRLDGRTGCRYQGTWSADQIVRMFTADRGARPLEAERKDRAP